RTVLLLKLGEQPHILDGDHRLVSEGSEQFRLLSGEGSGLRACSEDHADRLSIAQHGDREHAAVVGSPRHAAIREMWILKNIRNAHYRPTPDRPAGGASLVEWPREDFPERLGALGLRILDGDQAEKRAIVQHHCTEDGAAELESTRRDDVEYWLGIRMGAADSAQHVASCCLPGKGLRQLLITRLQLREQPHILDGDHSLIGEGLDELYLPVSERAHLSAPYRDQSDRLGAVEQRNAQNGPKPTVTGELTAERVVVRLGLYVCDVDRSSLADHASANSPVRQGKNGVRSDRSLVGDETQHVTINAEDRGVARLTQSGRARRHCREYRLDIGRRAGYHTEDVACRRLLIECLLRLVE